MIRVSRNSRFVSSYGPRSLPSAKSVVQYFMLALVMTTVTARCGAPSQAPSSSQASSSSAAPTGLLGSGDGHFTMTVENESHQTATFEFLSGSEHSRGANVSPSKCNLEPDQSCVFTIKISSSIEECSYSCLTHPCNPLAARFQNTVNATVQNFVDVQITDSSSCHSYPVGATFSGCWQHDHVNQANEYKVEIDDKCFPCDTNNSGGLVLPSQNGHMTVKIQPPDDEACP